MDTKLTNLQKSSSRVNVFLSFFVLINSIFGVVAKESQFGIAGIIGSSVFFCFDIFLSSCFFNNRRRQWIVLRAIELVVYSVCFVWVTPAYSVTFFATALLLLFFQMLFSCDYTDIFTRVIVIALCVAPSVITIIVSLLMIFQDSRSAFGKVCLLTGISMVVVILGNAAISSMSCIEEKLFEQRRLADNAKEINGVLKQHQEKLKKVNEEVGVQKIKLETAYNRINSANAEMILQNEILKQTASVMDVDQLLKVMTNILKDNLELDVCAIMLEKNFSESDNSCCCVASCYGEDIEADIVSQICEGCLEQYLDGENVYIDNHARAGDYAFLRECNIGSLMILPMMREEKVECILMAAHQRFDFFAENRVFFGTVMAQFMISLDNARLYTRIEQMAIQDGLTGIYNRRHLNLMMEKFSVQAEEEQKSLSVALFDIDHFKNINDTYGHLFGDLVIKTIAGFAKKMSEKYKGFAARYGGEEFVLAFQDRTVDECCAIVEEMRAEIAQMHLEYDGLYVGVNVSVGVTAYPQCCSNRNGLLEHADWAMYYSKKNGRNRVTVDSPEIRQSLGL